MPGTFVIKPLQADINSEHKVKLDPYCTFKVGKQKFRSQVSKKGNMHPTWTDTFTIPETQESVITVNIKDKEILLPNSKIASFTVDLKEIEAQGHVNKWYPIFHKNKQAGQILLEGQYQVDGVPVVPVGNMGNTQQSGIQIMSTINAPVVTNTESVIVPGQQVTGVIAEPIMIQDGSATLERPNTIVIHKINSPTLQAGLQHSEEVLTPLYTQDEGNYRVPHFYEPNATTCASKGVLKSIGVVELKHDNNTVVTHTHEEYQVPSNLTGAEKVVIDKFEEVKVIEGGLNTHTAEMMRRDDDVDGSVGVNVEEIERMTIMNRVEPASVEVIKRHIEIIQ